jgi:hypothetical protein
MKYIPNFNDPRVIKRTRQALQFALTALDRTQPHSWSTKYIDKFFGQQQLDLSKWLRNQLLICVDPHWNMETGKCKTYVNNPKGIAHVRSCLKLGSCDAAITIFDQELASGQFEYTEQADRLWHPLQRLPNQIRKPYMANHGYVYEYDIKACAPTLLLQYAQRLGMTKSTPIIDQYCQDRTQIRQQISDQLGIDIKTTKKIITALFAGATLSHNPKTAIYQMLNGNHQHIDQVRLITQELRKEIKCLWDVIKLHIPRTYVFDNKSQRRLRALTSKDKWNVYFQLEKEVMTSVRTYLKRSSVRYFNEHDGFRSQDIVDVVMLVSYVRSRTGYVIDLDQSICSSQ